MTSSNVINARTVSLVFLIVILYRPPFDGRMPRVFSASRPTRIFPDRACRALSSVSVVHLFGEAHHILDMQLGAVVEDRGAAHAPEDLVLV